MDRGDAPDSGGPLLRPASDPRFVSHLVRDSYGFVLAGGRGQRLGPLTDWRAKPAVPFGGKFRIIDFTLSNCVNSGVRRIGVATQYKAQSLIRHLQRGWSFLDGRVREVLDVLPAQQQIEENWYLGTADAVFQNLDVIRSDGCRYVLILSGDHVYKMDYGKLLADHVSRSADATIACVDVPLHEARAFGVVSAEAGGRIVAFDEKPADPRPAPGSADKAFVSMGVYVFNAPFLMEQLIRDAGDPKSAHDFGKNIIPHIVPRYRVVAHRFVRSSVGSSPEAPYWRDVGTVDAYYDANMELLHVVPELNLYDREWPIWTNQEQLPPAKFVFDDDGRRGVALASMVSGGCIISGATVRRSLLFSNVNVQDHASVEDCVILPDARIGRGAVLKRAILDRRCEIPDGLAIGVDREEDARRYHVSDNGVTLVTPEMLGQAAHQVRY